jgi:hypothetical protein
MKRISSAISNIVVIMTRNFSFQRIFAGILKITFSVSSIFLHFFYESKKIYRDLIDNLLRIFNLFTFLVFVQMLLKLLVA